MLTLEWYDKNIDWDNNWSTNLHVAEIINKVEQELEWNLDLNESFKEYLELIFKDKSFANYDFIKLCQQTNLNEQNNQLLNKVFLMYKKLYLNENISIWDLSKYQTFSNNKKEFFEYINILLETWEIKKENIQELITQITLTNTENSLDLIEKIKILLNHLKKEQIDLYFEKIVDNFYKEHNDCLWFIISLLINKKYISDYNINNFLEKLEDESNIQSFILKYLDKFTEQVKKDFFEYFEKHFEEKSYNPLEQNYIFIKYLSYIEQLFPYNFNTEKLKDHFDYQKFKIDLFKTFLDKCIFNIKRSNSLRENNNKNWDNSQLQEKYKWLLKKIINLRKKGLWNELELAEIYSNLARLNMINSQKWKEYATHALKIYEQYYQKNPLDTNIFIAVNLYEDLWYPQLGIDLLERMKNKLPQNEEYKNRFYNKISYLTSLYQTQSFKYK